MIMIVFRDLTGKVINIGPWDYMEIPQINDDTGEVSVIRQNPLPEGATSENEEVITLSDGGFAALNP